MTFKTFKVAICDLITFYFPEDGTFPACTSGYPGYSAGTAPSNSHNYDRPCTTPATGWGFNQQLITPENNCSGLWLQGVLHSGREAIREDCPCPDFEAFSANSGKWPVLGRIPCKNPIGSDRFAAIFQSEKTYSLSVALFAPFS